MEPDFHQNEQKRKPFLSTTAKILLFTLLFGFALFLVMGFLSTSLLYEDVEEAELAMRGENRGQLLKERMPLSFYGGIEQTERVQPLPVLEKLNTIRYRNNLAQLEPYLYQMDEESFHIQHGINSYVTTHGTEPSTIHVANKLNEKPLICIQDWFADGDLHGEYIYDYMHSLYDGPIHLLNNNELDFNMKSYIGFYKNCDIVSLSIGFTDRFNEELFLQNYGQNLKNKETVFIYAAGNDRSKDSEDVQKLSEFKLNALEQEKAPYDEINKAMPGYFIGVTQGIVDTMQDEQAYRIYSGGKAIELIVLNGDLYMDGTKISGTSFSVPFVAAMAANLLQAGVPKEQLLDYLRSDYELNDGAYSYSVVLADDIQNKINNLH